MVINRVKVVVNVTFVISDDSPYEGLLTCSNKCNTIIKNYHFVISDDSP